MFGDPIDHSCNPTPGGAGNSKLFDKLFAIHPETRPIVQRALGGLAVEVVAAGGSLAIAPDGITIEVDGQITRLNSTTGVDPEEQNLLRMEVRAIAGMEGGNRPQNVMEVYIGTLRAMLQSETMLRSGE